MGRRGYPRLVSGNIAPQLPQNSSQLGRPCCLFSKQHWDFPESATFHQATLLVVFTDTAWYLASMTPEFTQSSVAADRTSSPTPIGLVFLDWKKWICTCGVGNQMLRCSVLQQVPCLIRGCAEPVKRTVLHNSTVAHERLGIPQNIIEIQTIGLDAFPPKEIFAMPTLTFITPGHNGKHATQDYLTHPRIISSTGQRRACFWGNAPVVSPGGEPGGTLNGKQSRTNPS